MIDLAPLLAPASIAVVGASTDSGKVGGMPIRLLRSNGFPGAIYPVHRTAAEIQGLPAYRSVADIGRPVDLAIVAVPADACLATLDQLIEARVRAAVVFTSGFAETGAAGAALQATLADGAARHGIALLGPNCLGAMNLRRSVYATFSPVALDGAPPPGDVALVSQSGAFGGYAFALARRSGLGLSSWITTGNEAGVQVADAIRWLVDDDDTRVVLGYVEGARDLPRFEAALDAARAAGKPVALVKVGTTPAGARAARLHTGSDTGDDAAWNRLFDAYGVHRVPTLTALLRLGTVLSRGRRPRFSDTSRLTDDGPSRQASIPIAILTISGGVGIVMADRAAVHGLTMPPLPAGPAAALVAAVPFACTENPIDLTGQVFAKADVLIATLHEVARCGTYGYAVVFLAAAGRVPGLWVRIQSSILALIAEPDAAPLLFCGVFDDVQRDWLVAQGCLVFEEPTDAIDAVAALSGAGPHGDLRRGHAGTVP